MPPELPESARQDILNAASQLQGFRRRQFQAQMTLKYCEGKPRRAEHVFGWGRDAVNTGLHELRSGIRCLDNFSARGRHKSEEVNPKLVGQIEALIEPVSQADPQLKTPLAYTRITAEKVHQHLLALATDTDPPVPAKRTISDILNRLRYRLRRVRKTRPKKSSPRPTPSSTTSKRSTPRA